MPQRTLRKADIFADKATERKILSFVIKCPNEGCKWSGELRSKDNHLASCPLQVVSCTNDNCDVRLPRKDLQGHVTSTCDWRVLHCSHCDVSHAACKTEAHQSECKRMPLKCPNKCGAVVPREETSIHIENDCPLTTIPCPYAEMGCTVKVQRRKVESHLQSAAIVHLDLACAKLNDTRIQLRDTQHQLNDTQLQLRSTQEKVNALESPSLMQINGIHTWKICGFKEMTKQAESGNKTEINSPPFYDHGYKFGLTLEPNDTLFTDTFVSVIFFVMKGEYDAILSWPLPTKKVTITLIDQQDPRKRKNVVVSFTSDNRLFKPCFRRVENDGDKHMDPVGIALIPQDDQTERCYVVDDTIFIQVHIEPAQ